MQSGCRIREDAAGNKEDQLEVDIDLLEQFVSL